MLNFIIYSRYELGNMLVDEMFLLCKIRNSYSRWFFGLIFVFSSDVMHCIQSEFPKHFKWFTYHSVECLSLLKLSWNYIRECTLCWLLSIFEEKIWKSSWTLNTSTIHNTTFIYHCMHFSPFINVVKTFWFSWI